MVVIKRNIEKELELRVLLGKNNKTPHTNAKQLDSLIDSVAIFINIEIFYYIFSFSKLILLMYYL